MRKIDKFGTSEREKILPNIEDLHVLLEEMEGRVGQLKNECPTEWSPAKKEIDDGAVDMRGKYEETTEMITEDEKKRYVRVKDSAGNVFVCPIDALRDPSELTEEEEDMCVDDGTAGRHPSNIDIVDP